VLVPANVAQQAAVQVVQTAPIVVPAPPPAPPPAPANPNAAAAPQVAPNAAQVAAGLVAIKAAQPAAHPVAQAAPKVVQQQVVPAALLVAQPILVEPVPISLAASLASRPCSHSIYLINDDTHPSHHYTMHREKNVLIKKDIN
jgi:hypothetical protein